MDVPTFMLQRHQDLHQKFFPSLKEQLTEEEFRLRPAEGMQPIAWLIWHLARVEDMGLSRFVWNKPQLYDEAWQTKINTNLTHYGTSMTDDEVGAFAAKVNPFALMDYFAKVGERTVEELQNLDVNMLDEIIEEVEVRRIVIDEGLASDQAHWVIPHYVGKTRGWMLCHMGLTHNFRHFGQITLVKKMLKMA